MINNIRKTIKNANYILGLAIKHDVSTLVIIILESIVNAAKPFILIIFPRFIIDSLLNKEDIKIITSYIVVMALAYFILQIINDYLSWHRTLKTMKLYDYFGILLAKKSMETDFQNIENADKLNDFQKAENSIWYSSIGSLSVLVGCIVNIFKFVGLSYILASINPFIILLITLICIFDFLYGIKNQKNVFENMNHKADSDRKIKYLSETMADFRYGKDIRLYNFNEMFLSYFDKNKDKNLMYQKKIFLLNKSRIFFNIVLSYILRGLLYAFYSYQCIIDKITIGEYTMLISAAESFYMNFSALINNSVELKNFTMYINQYKNYLDYKDEINNGKGIKEIDKSNITIEFKCVSFKYPNTNQYIIKNVSFIIENKTKVTIVGDNGAGKSTLIKLLLRLYDVTEGQILVNGVNIKEYDYTIYLKLFTAVFQDYKLMSLSLLDNIVPRSEDIIYDNLKASIDKSGFANRFSTLKNGLNTYLNKDFDNDGIEFSGGEKQKIAIARALYKDACVCILDEPTAALDPRSEQDIYNNFNNVVENKTAIYISHRMSSCRFCDKIIVFEKGEIVEMGNHEELMQNNKCYKKMWDSQAKYYL